MSNNGRTTKNQFLSASDQRQYMAKLREAAEKGDINAMGWMVMLSNQDKHQKSQAKLSHAGWVGEKNDPKQQILNTIRENDPDSQQLPENK